MIDKLLYKIADWHNEILRKKGILNNENYSDIDYIFRSNLWNILTMLVFIIFGVIFKTLPQMMWIFLSFNILRDKCGGWHSYGNLTYCFFSSLVIFNILALFCKIFYIFSPYLFIVAVICALYTFCKAPIMLEEDLYQDKWQFKFDYLVLAIVCILAGYFSGYGICVYMSIILCAAYMSKTCEKVNIFVRSLIFR